MIPWVKIRNLHVICRSPTEVIQSIGCQINLGFNLPNILDLKKSKCFLQKKVALHCVNTKDPISVKITFPQNYVEYLHYLTLSNSRLPKPQSSSKLSNLFKKKLLNFDF